MKNIFYVFPLLIVLVSCSKDEEIPQDNPILDANYEGWLDIRFTNEYPPWDVSKRLQASINKKMEVILFETGSLSYSGEKIISNSSKITRTGNWLIEPAGFLKKSGADISIEVDGGVKVQNDIQRIYGKNNSGEWILLNETDFSSSPDAQLVFSLNEATINGSVVKVTAETGSISWSLFLVPALVE